MQKTPRELAIRASEWLNLPTEATMGLPRVDIVGNRRVSVENHRGVGAFGPEYMELLTRDGAIQVRGQALTLIVMNHQELVVTGQIRSVELP